MNVCRYPHCGCMNPGGPGPCATKPTTLQTVQKANRAARRILGMEPRDYAALQSCRIEQAYKQRPLFDAEPQRKPEQLGLEG